MKIKLSVLFSLMLLSFFYTMAFDTLPNDNENWRIPGKSIGITTGSSTGTYIKFGETIKRLAKDENVNVKVYESKGSVSNMIRLIGKKTYDYDRDDAGRPFQFGIVQHDSLKYFETRVRREEGLDLKNYIKVVLPLYSEEVHILVNKDSNINDIMDLEGKKVSIDQINSGSWVTGTVIRRFLGLEWRQYNYSPKESIVKVINGEIDAFIYVAGIPTKNFEALSNLKKIKKKDANSVVKLLDVKPSWKNKDNPLWRFYYEAEIPASSYKWLKEDVQTLKTKAVLVTWNYKKNSSKEWHRYTYDNIDDIIISINDNLSTLQRDGHPKWKQVDLKDTEIDWPFHEKALEALEYINTGKIKITEEDLFNF